MWHLVLILHLQTVPVPLMYPSVDSCLKAAQTLPVQSHCRRGLLIMITRGAA